MNYLALAIMLAFVSCSSPGQATVLVTAKEAQLPRAEAGEKSGIDRGTPIPRPDVSLESPLGVAVSPFLLRVTFKPHNGTRIDPDTVRIKLMTKPEVDLTSRLRPYITANGLNCGQAEVPPGVFSLRIILGDSAGNFTTQVIDLQVQHP
jgi:hypothetical protein